MEQARIMIVEDERIVAKNLEQRLKRLGYIVTAVVASGAEAIQQAEETRPDVVLMDIQLQGEMDGVEAAERIRARRHIPVLYLTAFSDDRTVQRALLTEPFSYIIKPFEVRDLHVRIQGALGRHALEQQRNDFHALLTHDIKQPLSVILGYADMLTEELRARGLTALENLLDKMQSNAFTVHSLVANYLQLFTIEAGHLPLAKKPLAINDIVQHVARQYDTEVRLRRLSLDLRLQEDLPEVEGDLAALEQVFANLVSNALKFTPAQGRVTVTSAWQDGTVVATIADTGRGMAPEEIPVLFEKYRRTERDKSQPGTGLGLFIVKSIVEAHGGRVEVASTLGAGACFAVYLPVAPTADDNLSLPPPPSPY